MTGCPCPHGKVDALSFCPNTGGRSGRTSGIAKCPGTARVGAGCQSPAAGNGTRGQTKRWERACCALLHARGYINLFFFYPLSPETKQELGNKPLLAVSVSLQERGVELRGGEAVAPGRLLQVLLVTNTPD